MLTGNLDVEMLKSLSLILIAVMFGVSGQICLKLGVNGLDKQHFVFAAATSPYVIGGLMLYGLGAMVWIVVLSRVDLSFAYPMLGLTYIGVLLASALILGETVGPLRWLGTLIILTGVFLVARSY